MKEWTVEDLREEGSRETWATPDDRIKGVIDVN